MVLCQPDARESGFMTLSIRTGFSSPVSVAELGIQVDDPIEHLQDCHRTIERTHVTVQSAVASLPMTEPDA
jgi:hypothetical protein